VVHALHAGSIRSRKPAFPAAKVVDWISVPLGVATLRDQFVMVEDDAARFRADEVWYFEEPCEVRPLKDEQKREGFQIVGHIRHG